MSGRTRSAARLDRAAQAARDLTRYPEIFRGLLRFTEDLNPWTQRERLPRLKGGLLGEIAYANKPVIIEDLAARLRRDDPGYTYLEGFGSLFASPQYDNGEGVNVSASLLPPGAPLDPRVLPMLHWQSGLFGRGTHNLVLKNQLAEALGAKVEI